MVTNIAMPKFGLSMEEGTIGTWLKKEGDPVQKGDALAEVATDKITNTVEATGDGILRKIIVAEGDTVPCGDIICIIADANEDIGGAPVAAAPAALTEAAPAATAAPALVSAAPAAQPCDVLITPRAKKIAADRGIAYAHIKGTGINGAITVDDLKQYGKPIGEVPAVCAESISAPVAAPAQIPAAAPAKPAVCVPVYKPEDGAVVTQMTPIQGIIFKKMYESIQTTAQTTIATEADVTPLTKVYEGLKGKYKAAGVKLSYTAMLVKAVAVALENHPIMRRKVVDATHIAVSDRINIGIAIDTPNGLVVPVIKDANLKDLRTISLEISDLSARAKASQLTSADMENGTITITNLGMFDITYFTPVLNIPESAILGVGAIIQKVLVKDGGFFVGSVMNLSLTHDHRVIDGAPAARFLQDVTAGLRDFKWV